MYFVGLLIFICTINCARSFSLVHEVVSASLIFKFICYLSYCSSHTEPPSTHMWTLFLLAQVYMLVLIAFFYVMKSVWDLIVFWNLMQHYDRRRQYEKALMKINQAIAHTPTVIDLYLVKVLKSYLRPLFWSCLIIIWLRSRRLLSDSYVLCMYLLILLQFWYTMHDTCSVHSIFLGCHYWYWWFSFYTLTSFTCYFHSP